MDGWIIWDGMAFWLWDFVSATASDAGTSSGRKDDMMFFMTHDVMMAEGNLSEWRDE